MSREAQATGGDGATWWEDTRPTAPEPAGTRPRVPPIFGADCTA